MRNVSDLFLINGKPLIAPDSEPKHGYEDIDSPETGRAEDGVMHRSVVRYKVGTWEFKYARLTEEEVQYMESLFPDEPTFQFTRPKRTNSTEMITTECYRSKYSLSWFSAKDGVWKNYTFNIIEC